jgi:hypothetical protein
MATIGLDWQIDDHIRDLDELDRIIMVDRLVVDAFTDSNDVTPTLTLNNTEVALTAINNAARSVTDTAVDRIGPINRLKLTYTDNLTIEFYNVDLVIRPLDLGINVLPGGQRTQVTGRAPSPSTEIFYDISPFAISTDARIQNAIVQRLYIDAVTGAETITPVLVFDDGTTSSLAGLTAASRTITEYAIGTTQRLRRLRLDGDFTNSSIIVYDVELDLYVSKSQLS